MSIGNSRFPLSPTVSKFEVDYTTTVRNSLDFSGAYVGAFRWGPACEFEYVYDTNDLLAKFSEPKDWNFRHHFAVEDYLAYSAPVIVVRAIDDATYNAYSGNEGVGFEGTAQVVNGEILGVTYVNRGQGYQKGDILVIDTDHAVVTTAAFEVDSVDPFGAITNVNIIDRGQGFIQGDILTPSTINIQIKNDDDFSAQIEQGCEGKLESTTSIGGLFPTVIARFPGEIGNCLMFSSARASEFDSWTYKEAFNRAPAATYTSYEIGENANDAEIDSNLFNEWGSDWVVTINGFEVKEGIAPNEYQLDQPNNKIIFNTETENFVGTNVDTEFTLSNTFTIPTTNSIVKVDGIVIPQWINSTDVPSGFVRVNGNTLTFGIATFNVSGDGINQNFQMNFGTETIDIADLQITADGSNKTIITTGTPVVGEVLVNVTTIGTDNVLELEFNSGDLPAFGSGNIIAKTGFINTTQTIEVEYGFPENGTLKIFGEQTEIHAVVVDMCGEFGTESGEILEAYSFLSLSDGVKNFDGTLNYYKDAINKQSNYVRIGGDLFTHNDKRLSNGTDSLKVNNEELEQEWLRFQDSDAVKFNYLIGGPADLELSNWLIDNILGCRCDVFGAFSPEFSDVVCNERNVIENVIEWRSKLRATTYAMTEGNWKLRYDQYSDVYRWLPLSQDTIGLVARSNRDNGNWVSPAGTDRGVYKNIARLAYSPTRQQRDRLYPNEINPVFHMQNVGPVLYGDKTLSGRNSYFSQIGVRMLFIRVSNDIAETSRDFLFENNNQYTRQRFYNVINPYMRNLLGQGAFAEYRVVVDETNNTSEVINTQTLKGNILIRPSPSINFICLEFTAVKHGISFEEIIDNQRLN